MSNGMEEPDTSFRGNDPRQHPEAAPLRSSSSAGARPIAAPIMTTVDDGVLLGLVGQGDETAMATLFDRYSRVVYSVALRVLRDPAAAEDVLQEVFMQIWRKPETLVGNRGAVGAWLAVVSRNRSIDLLRRRKPTDSVEDVVLASPMNLANESERNVMIERARAIMVALPMEQRKTLEMAFFDGLTHSDIAETTGDALGTVKTRIRTALLVLRKAMQA